MQLSKRVSQMKESATLEMAKKARALTSQGVDIINLSLGEPDFDTPTHVIEAAKEGLDKGYTRYTPVNGLLDLRQAISDKFQRDNELSYSPDQIVVSNGAKQSIANVFLALLDDAEDEVIVLSPYWVSYVAMIKVAGGTPIMVNASANEAFKAPIDRIEQAINDKTKALIFSSPSNPTGAVWSKAELDSLALMLQKYPNIVVISDEIYEFINYVGIHRSIASCTGMKERTVTVNGFSKGFAMTGWRLGYIGAPLQLAKACTKIQGQYTSGANAFSQYAGAKALNEDYGPSKQMKKAYEERKKLVMKRMAEFPDFICPEPEGAFYVFPDISAVFGRKLGSDIIQDANDFSYYLLEHAHVAVVSGAAFGEPNCIRISFAASEDQINRAFDAIKASLR